MVFSKVTYIDRRKRLQESVGGGLLLFLGNDLVGMNYAGNEYHFRQDSTFLYYFGLDFPGLAAVIDIDNDRTIVFGDELTIDDIVWTGIQPTVKEKCETVGVTESMPLNRLKWYVDIAVSGGQNVHFLPPYRGDHFMWIQEVLGIQPNAQENKASVDFIKAVVDMRNHKTEDELNEIEKAIDISTDMHLLAYKMAKPGVEEAQIAAAVAEVGTRHGETLAFPTIATTHGQTLHNHGFIHTLQDGDIFLLDAGAETKNHYAGDLSSSMPVSEHFTTQQEEIYNIHLQSFKAAVDCLAPGIPFRQAHIAAATKIAWPYERQSS